MAVICRPNLPRILVRRQLSTTSRPQVTIGIRREDPARIWERRCPITPDAVEHLVRKENVKVLVQDCDRRVFPVTELVKAGAQIHPTLAPAHIIVGIKETPVPEILTSPLPSPVTSPSPSSPSLVPRTHLMFSHTTKGQIYNMELLSKFLKDNDGTANGENGMGIENGQQPRLIDYELLVGEDGKRTVGFGWFAGVAGVLESLSAVAHAHLEIGVASPFLHTPRPHTHPSIPSLRAKLREVGDYISREGTPKCLGPFVVCVTGNGNVAQGMFDILKELPIVNVTVQDLPALVANPDTDLHKVYLVHALPQDYLSRIDGGYYQREDYYKHPESYRSDFHTKVAPYLTLFLNGAGWAPSFPRLMTNEQLAVALELAKEVGRGRFTSIGDISCDIGGGLEFLTHPSTLSDPFYTVRPTTIPPHLPSVQMMAVDILPSSLPLDASKHFSDALFPYLRSLIVAYKGEDAQGSYEKALSAATVAQAGELVGKHTWLREPLGTWKASLALKDVNLGSTPVSLGSEERWAKPKKVLMLGSGMVAGPAVDEICKRADIDLLVASNSVIEADKLVRHHPNARSVVLDITDRKKVGRLISEADIVISLLPVPFHPSVAELCIERQKHLITASYISPAMNALHERAQSADVLLLNEIGLDPGIDHCSAISLLSDLRAQNKQVVSFTSFCGGLPAPENADVPLGYKFSWSPRGVLGAALNSARFKLNGTDWEIPGANILQSYFPEVPISNILKLEGIANRDSIPYADTYNLGAIGGLRTVLRGTLRYPGFCDLMHSFKALGLLETTTSIVLDNWASLTRLSLQKRYDIKIQDDPASVLSAISSLVPLSHIDSLTEALSWLSIIPGKLSSSPLPPLPQMPTPPIDLFTIILARKLKYEPKERDIVILSHEIVAKSPSNPEAEEIHTSSLITYGTPTASAMARCVGLPVAFAALQVLDGEVSVRGVHGPTDKAVYGSVLRGLEEVGLGMKENIRRGRGMEDTLTAGLISRHSLC